MTTREIPGYCTLCRSRCGALYTVEGERLLAARPNPAHPTGKALCPKGRAAPEIVHDPRRPTRPLRRTRPKGDPDPGWVEISWEEALAETAERLGAIRAESGAESVAFAVTTPSGTPIVDSIEWIERFVRLFGSPNIVYGTEVCNWHKDWAHAYTFGQGMPIPDYAEAEVILLWGHNPANTWLAQAGKIAEGRAKGARLIAVDPRRAGSVLQADHWLRVRPGSDAALALGLIRLCLEARAWDEAFVREWSNAPFLVAEDDGRFLRDADGRPLVWRRDLETAAPYDAARPAAQQDAAQFALEGRFTVEGRACRPAFALLAEAVAGYTPARVEAETGVPAAELEAAARTLFGSRRVAYYAWTGVGQQANASQTERALAILYALTGAWDRPGGNVVWSRQPGRAVNGFDLLAPEQRAKALGLDRHPLGPPSKGWITGPDFSRAVLERAPYGVRALVGFGSNLLLSQAGTADTAAALRALEFHVQLDRTMTPTAMQADLFLPVTAPWEHEALKLGFEIDGAAEELVQLRSRIVPPPGACRSDTEIVFDLACRLGLAEAFFGGDIERARDHQLEPLGLTTADLRARPEGIRRPLEHRFEKYAEAGPDGAPRGFATESRRVELYSELLLRHGYAPLPEHRAPPEPGGAFPLRLTSAKNGLYCHSQQRNLVSLRRRAPDPTVTLHPEAAAARGLAEGDPVELRTPLGSARFVLRLDASLDPAVAVGEHGWWQACPEQGRYAADPLDPAGSNYNLLIESGAVDPISGSQPLRTAVCEVAALALPVEAGRRWRGFRPFRVTAVERETGAVAALTLEPEDGGPLSDFLPGQHVTLAVEGLEGGRRAERSYSLIGVAEASGRRGYRIAVKSIAGLVSTHLVERLRPGATVALRAPSGSFLPPLRSDLPVVLLAGGIGITPFLGYLERLAERPSAMPEVHLYYANRDGAGQAFRERLRLLAASLPRLTLVESYSRPRPEDEGERGRLGAARLPQALIEARARFWLCGPQAMMDDLVAGLQARGVPRFDLFTEAFASPAPSLVEEPAGPFTVRFAGSGRDLLWKRGDGDLLSFAEANGLGPPAGCRVGQCESCALTLVEGQVLHRVPPALDEESLCLTCQAVPASDLVLDG